MRIILADTAGGIAMFIRSLMLPSCIAVRHRMATIRVRLDSGIR